MTEGSAMYPTTGQLIALTIGILIGYLFGTIAGEYFERRRFIAWAHKNENIRALKHITAYMQERMRGAP